MKSSKKGIVFKPYNPNQQMLLPPSLNELILERHPVRVVNQIVERIDFTYESLVYFSGISTVPY